MEGCKVIGKDSLSLCGLVIIAFAILVRVSVGLGGYSGELSDSWDLAHVMPGLQEPVSRPCMETTKHKDTGWKLLSMCQLINGVYIDIQHP